MGNTLIDPVWYNHSAADMRFEITTHRPGCVLHTDLCFLLEREPLDGDETVGLGVSDHHPPALLAFLNPHKHTGVIQQLITHDAYL